MKWYLKFTFLLFPLLMKTSGVFSAEPVRLSPTSNPDNQYTRFTNIKERLKAMPQHHFPVKLKVVIGETEGTPATTGFDCSASCPVDRVMITVFGEAVVWDPKLTYNGVSPSGETDETLSGAYIWFYDPPFDVIEIDGTVTRHVNYHTFIMLNPEVTKRNESNFAESGPYINDCILYHEFLHGELPYNFMVNSDTWKIKVCCSSIAELDESILLEFLQPDDNHGAINNLEEQFLSSILQSVPTVYVLNATPYEAAKGTDGYYVKTITLEPPKPNAVPKIISSQNTKDNIYTIKDNGATIELKFRLDDPNSMGWVFYNIDPDNVYYFPSIEHVIYAKPAATIPTLTGWSLIILGLIFLSFGSFYLLRRAY